MFERSRKGENALLIQPHSHGPADEGALEEFSELARSAGARVAAVIPARIDKPNAATLFDSGKLDERGGRRLKLLSGAVMLALGLVMLLRPQWLM